MANAEANGTRMKAAAAIVLHAGLYVTFGELSFATAYLQANTATIWIPSGYAIALLIVEGPSRWPAVALGSFLLNLTVNVGSGRAPFVTGVAVAAAIALGNTAEALLGAALARRYAGGVAFFRRPRGVALFALLVAPIAPLFSMGIGVVATSIGGLAARGDLVEIMLTWYTANAIGILIFTAPLVVARTTRHFPKPPGEFGGPLEAFVLAASLILVSEAICGIYLTDGLRGWPRTYMIFPFLVWAAFRFGTPGAMLAVLLVTAISVVGTIAGFAAFPAETASRSLIYLQVFLGVASTLGLLISAGLWENWDLRMTLEEKVRARTAEIDRHLREKEAFTVLVAHDLQSPLYGVRNALHAAVEAIDRRRLDALDLVPALAVMESTCAALAERIASLLAPARADPEADRAVELAILLRRIAATHRFSMDGKDARLRFIGDGSLAIRSPDKVEHILDALIDNALKVSPAGACVEIAAELRQDTIHIRVTDRGSGVPAGVVAALSTPRPARADSGGAPSAGLGLSLAHRQAMGLGGELSCVAATPQGSTFRLVFPAVNPTRSDVVQPSF